LPKGELRKETNPFGLGRASKYVVGENGESEGDGKVNIAGTSESYGKEDPVLKNGNSEVDEEAEEENEI
jgi:hypothetical protein